VSGYSRGVLDIPLLKHAEPEQITTIVTTGAGGAMPAGETSPGRPTWPMTRRRARGVTRKLTSRLGIGTFDKPHDPCW